MAKDESIAPTQYLVQYICDAMSAGAKKEQKQFSKDEVGSGGRASDGTVSR